MSKYYKNITCRCTIFGALMFCFMQGNSQDIQFSQFYSSPLYLNPAFAGSAHHHRIITQNRWQWPGLDAKYNTYSLTYDSYFNQLRSGIGLMVTHDRQGSGSYNTTEVQGLYSHELHLSEKYTIRVGAQAGMVTKALNVGDKTFTDQYSNRGYDANSPSGEDLSNPRKNMLDIGLGTIFYSKNLWLGLASNHVNSPNQSYVIGASSRLPVKYSVVGGYKIPLTHNKHMAYLEDEKDISITPTFIYKFQGKSDQVDVGVYGQYDQLLAGVWYRGIPTKQYQSDIQNNESMIFQLGWHFSDFSVGYSYDLVISKLHSAMPKGAHEINLTYIIHKHHKGAKPMKRLPCPHFYKGS